VPRVSRTEDGSAARLCSLGLWVDFGALLGGFGTAVRAWVRLCESLGSLWTRFCPCLPPIWVTRRALVSVRARDIRRARGDRGVAGLAVPLALPSYRAAGAPYRAAGAPMPCSRRGSGFSHHLHSPRAVLQVPAYHAPAVALVSLTTLRTAPVPCSRYRNIGLGGHFQSLTAWASSTRFRGWGNR